LHKTAVSRIIVTLLLVGILISAFNVNVVKAYKSGSDGTHQFIFSQAKEILKNDGYRSYAAFLDSLDPAAPGRTYLQVMIAGSDDHDDIISAREHYHDPMGHNGLYYFFTYWKSAAQLCQERFDEAVSHWLSNNYHEAIYDLGWATHMVQDACVPHHAMTSAGDWHSEFESWVNDNKYSFAVNYGGIYSFSSLPDYQYYKTEAVEHYSWDNASAYDWVDYNAHESDKYSLSVNGKSLAVVGDFDPDGEWGGWIPYIETIHPLPNNLEASFEITKRQTSSMRLQFLKLDMETNYDYVYIYDKHDNLLGTYTGKMDTAFWTPWYSVDTLKIRVKTDGSTQSWGYKIISVENYDTDEDLYGATSVLLSRAQRTTAGFIKFFFDAVRRGASRSYVRPGKGSVAMYISPQDSLFESPSTTNGTWFTINVRIASATAVAMWQAEILYKKALLYTTPANITYAADHLFPLGKYTPFTPTVDSFNTTHNYILHSAISLPYQEYNATDAGLTTIKFQIIRIPGPGEVFYSLVYFTVTPETPGIFGSYTLDYDLNENDITLKDGYYENRCTLQRDVAVVDASPFKTVVGQGFSSSINITVENQGNLTETLNIAVYANATVISTLTNITLTSGNSTTITVFWNTSGYVKGIYIIWAYVTPVPYEIDTSDNNCTDGTILVTIPGDVNGDKKVDGKDIAIIAKAFGKRKGQPGYVPNADVNCDGQIDGKDIAIASKNFGKRWT